MYSSTIASVTDAAKGAMICSRIMFVSSSIRTSRLMSATVWPVARRNRRKSRSVGNYWRF